MTTWKDIDDAKTAAIVYSKLRYADPSNRNYFEAMMALGMKGRAHGFMMMETYEQRRDYVAFLVRNAEKQEWCQQIVSEAVARKLAP